MMLKQSPSRNLRSKGFKVKHALQIFVLLAICIWLLYQVKHSHDKKKPYEESSMKISEKMQSGHEILVLGRKGIRPRVEETTKGGDEEEEEEESKIEENEDDARGGGDDEIDGHDQGRGEEEDYEQGEDLIDEQDEEREEGIEDQENEEKENHIEDEDHNRVERNSQEAREENYKKDDASSAVVHNTQTIRTETENIRLRKVKEEEQENLTDSTDEVNFDEKDSAQKEKVGEDETMEKIEGKENDTDVGSNFNSSTKAVSNEESEVNTSSTLMQVETYGSLSKINILPESLKEQNVTSNEILLSNMQTIVLEQNENFNTTAENEQSDLDSTPSATTHNSDTAKPEREIVDSSIDFEPQSVAVERIGIVKLDSSDGTEESSASTITKNNETDRKGYSNAYDGSEEATGISEPSTTTITEIVGTFQNESFDSSDSAFYQEDREKLSTDLVTLPEIGTRNSKEDAEE